MSEFLKTKDVSRLTGWCSSKVTSLIKSGKLPAKNTSTGKRPTYQVRRSDLDLFMLPPDARQRPMKSRKPDAIDSNVPKVF